MISGITGQFFRQFAVTIAAATVISAFVSLTLSPALCALLLKPHAEGHATRKRSILARGRDVFFAGFNAVFDRLSLGYGQSDPAPAARRARSCSLPMSSFSG